MEEKDVALLLTSNYDVAFDRARLSFTSLCREELLYVILASAAYDET